MNDLIERQAAIDVVRKAKDKSEAHRMLIQLPSAKPQRIKGRWIDDGLYSDNFPHHAWHCSECEESVLEIDEPWFKFCPNCGAYMRGEQDG